MFQPNDHVIVQNGMEAYEKYAAGVSDGDVGVIVQVDDLSDELPFLVEFGTYATSVQFWMNPEHLAPRPAMEEI